MENKIEPKRSEDKSELTNLIERLHHQQRQHKEALEQNRKEKERLKREQDKIANKLAETEKSRVLKEKEDNVRIKALFGAGAGAIVGVPLALVAAFSFGAATPGAIAGTMAAVTAATALVGGGIGAAIGTSDLVMQKVINASSIKDIIERKKAYSKICDEHKLGTYILSISTCIVIIGKSLEKLGAFALGDRTLTDCTFEKIAKGLDEPINMDEDHKKSIGEFVDKISNFSNDVIKRPEDLREFFRASDTADFVDVSFNSYNQAVNLCEEEKVVTKNLHETETTLLKLNEALVKMEKEKEKAALKEMLAKLIKEESFTFTLTRLKPHEILVQFTAENSVLMMHDEIKKHLIELVKLLKGILTTLELNDKCEIVLDWKSMSIKISAKGANIAVMHSIGSLLEEVGENYWDKNNMAKTLFFHSQKVSSAQEEPKNQEGHTINCAMQ